ncbi:caspase family protein [Labrys monachus]|uniref:Caspase family p20 domain-containing protein n=1 Tax=Labrys monachus TaxID=217067 RepID=A0ABU0FAV8_9HYPH|nr:caspase family protein [Labrys monachus]MDQ0391752.1 putative caspase-like protein/putative protein [Labrys monachus]
MKRLIRLAVSVVLNLVFAAWLGMVSAHAAPKAALVIGNGAYRSVTPLVNPANDASDMAASLGRLGYRVTLVRDGDLQAMNDGVRAFLRDADHADSVVVFYSGHGVQVKGRNYLIPVSAKIADELDLDTQALSLDKLLDLVDGASAKVKIVILDSCRDNPLAHALVRGAGTRGLARVDLDASEAKGTLIAFSTAPGSVAQDGTGRNSPFTQALLAHMGTPGLDIRQMFGQVRADVDQATQGAQTPWVNEAIIGSFAIAGSVADPQPVTVVQPAQDNAAAVQPTQAAQAFAQPETPVRTQQASLEPEPPEQQQAFAVPAEAAHPSFRCDGMLNPAEATICRNGGLAALDQSLAATYGAVLSALSGNGRAQLTTNQADWRAQRDRCGSDADCIAASYRQRLALLGQVARSADRVSPSFPCGGRLNPAERAICGNGDLARLDQALTVAFKLRFRALPDQARAPFSADQAAWRSQRDRCGSAVACIATAYWQRLNLLQSGP